MNSKACLAALIFATSNIALGQVPVSDPPLPNGTANDDLIARMAARRAQQLNQPVPNVVPARPINPVPAANAVNAPTPPFPPAETPATLPVPPHLQAIVQRLASDDFSTRETAQKELDQFTWRDQALLKQLAEATPDPEAKSRLLARLQTIEEQIVLDPPPISLDLKNAQFFEVISALEKATGEKLSDSNRNFNNGIQPAYTLSVKDKPFWEVFRDLNDQHPIQIQGYNGMRLYQQSPPMRPTQIVGGMATFAQVLTRSAIMDFQNNPGQKVATPTLNFQYAIAIDPRMKIVKFQQPHLTEVVDDAGNTLFKDPPRPAQQNWNSQPLYHVWSLGQALTIPEKIGKTIASAKGEFHLQIQLASQSLDVTDVEKKLNNPITVAGQTAVITQFNIQGNIINFQMNRKFDNPNQNFQDAPTMNVSFIDANGQVIWTGTLQGGSGGGVGGNAIAPPVKVQFSVSTKTKDLTIPFEFKDLPIP